MSRPPVVGAEMGQGAAPPRTCLFPYKMGQWKQLPHRVVVSDETAHMVSAPFQRQLLEGVLQPDGRGKQQTGGEGAWDASTLTG